MGRVVNLRDFERKPKDRPLPEDDAEVITLPVIRIEREIVPGFKLDNTSLVKT